MIEQILVGALWVAAVGARRRASFRRKLFQAGYLLSEPLDVPDFDLHRVESFLGHPPRGRITSYW